MAWVLPAILIAASTSAFTRSTKDVPTPIDRLESIHQKVIPAPLNQILKDPHNPLLNDTRGLPAQLAPKTYMGKVELPKPTRLMGESPNYAQQFINVATVPYSNQKTRMKLINEAFRTSLRGQILPWFQQRPDTRRTRVIFRSDDFPSVRSGAGKPFKAKKQSIQNAKLIALEASDDSPLTLNGTYN